MQKKAKVAIVGRPNVGKSLLFNRIAGKRIAIVDEAEGVTRDRLYTQVEIFGNHFELIDTGGIHTHSKVDFNEEIRRQAFIAIEEADSLIFVVDQTAGVTDLDLLVAKILRKTEKPVCLAVNKMDDATKEISPIFKSLGIEHMVAVSAQHGRGIGTLIETTLKPLSKEILVEQEVELPIPVALLGRPNVGKSSLINQILSEERQIVSPIAGTTRDAIDIPFTFNGQLFSFIDTAGIRRKAKEKEVVEKFSSIRTQDALERASVCLFMCDATQGITQQEKKILHNIEKSGKSCILLINKWDLVKETRMEHYLKDLHTRNPFLATCPTLFISAETGRNVEKVFPLIQACYEKSQGKIPTPQLNKFIEKSIQLNHPPMIGGKRLRIYYMTQVSTSPLMFVLFVNAPHLMESSFKRYLINRFKETFDLMGVPVRFILKGKKRHKEASKTLKDIRISKEMLIPQGKLDESFGSDEEDTEDMEEDIFFSEEDLDDFFEE